LAARSPALPFTITTHPETNAALIKWEQTPADLSADDALTRYYAAKSGPEPLSRAAAKSWLTDFLKSGPEPVSKIELESHRAGLTWSTVQRAADQLPVTRTRQADGHWCWSLPNTK
jgi:hypothetical protein